MDSVGSVFGRPPQHTLPVGEACPNCATTLAGPWCHACGQSSEDFHRSIVRLAAEAIGGLVDVDSRIWRTLPNLCLRPARLTRAYLDGHRVTQAPPFRLFLIVVVLVFLVAGLGRGSDVTNFRFEDGSGHVLAGPGGPSVSVAARPRTAFGQWVEARLQAAAKNPARFQAALIEWAQRLAFLTLPIAAALLGISFVFRRGVYLFDHLIFSMHSLSFQGLLLSTVMLAGLLTDWSGWLMLLSPVHLFVHLRGTYRIGVFGTLARMTFLFAGSAFAMMLVLSGLVFIGLYEVGA